MFAGLSGKAWVAIVPTLSQVMETGNRGRQDCLPQSLVDARINIINGPRRASSDGQRLLAAIGAGRPTTDQKGRCTPILRSPARENIRRWLLDARPISDPHWGEARWLGDSVWRAGCP